MEPALLTDFDMAWLSMSAARRSAVHRAVLRAAAQPDGGGAEGLLRAVQAAVSGEPLGAGAGDESDPAAMLCALQQALQDVHTDPGQLLGFEIAWLGMQPHQQKCIYRAVMRLRAPGAPGAGADQAALVRQLAAHAVASLQHAAGASRDPHAVLCTLQDMLAGADLEPAQLARFECAWLGQRSAAWWESMERMVSRAHAQGPDALRAVIAAVIRSGGTGS